MDPASEFPAIDKVLGLLKQRLFRERAVHNNSTSAVVSDCTDLSKIEQSILSTNTNRTDSVKLPKHLSLADIARRKYQAKQRKDYQQTHHKCFLYNSIGNPSKLVPKNTKMVTKLILQYYRVFVTQCAFRQWALYLRWKPKALARYRATLLQYQHQLHQFAELEFPQPKVYKYSTDWHAQLVVPVQVAKACVKRLGKLKVADLFRRRYMLRYFMLKWLHCIVVAHDVIEV